jgi:endonuclease I
MKKLLLTSLYLSLICFFAASQIPPGYYDGTEGLYGEQLKAVLHNIIDDHIEPSYNDLRDFILPESDEDPQNPDNVILLYTGRSQAKNTFGGGINEWNREHVWAKSHGDFGNDPPCGTDAHMIRPTDVSVNADRGNKDFDEGGQQHPEASGCYYTSYTWEPRDEVKGDVARMILYMDVRYEGDNNELDLVAVDAVNTSPAPEHGRLSTLLLWHEQDPPDDFEVNRNEVVYGYQQNRNPFIDHPEFVSRIWDPAVKVDEMHSLTNTDIYPNPAKTKVYIHSESNADQLNVTVYTLMGNRLISLNTNGTCMTVLDCSVWPEGLYFIHVRDEQSGSTYVSKITKTE